MFIFSFFLLFSHTRLGSIGCFDCTNVRGGHIPNCRTIMSSCTVGESRECVIKREQRDRPKERKRFLDIRLLGFVV
jgi:hypothetical protein